MRKKLSTMGLGLALFLLLCPALARGAGFALYENGAAALAMGGAFVAQADDPSALFYNPAGITQLEGRHVSAGVTAIIPNFEFKSQSSGQKTSPENDVEFPATAYYTQQLSKNLWCGLSFFSPFGLVTDWPKDWEGRYISLKSDIRTYTINPNIAVKLAKGVSFAIGAEALYFDAELTKAIPVSPAASLDPSTDVVQKLKGDAFGFGLNTAIHLAYKNLRLGVSYRSPIQVDIDGSVSFEHTAASIAVNGPANLPDGGGETSVKLPQSVAVGLAYTFFERLTLEADFQWTDWTSMDSLDIVFDKPLFSALKPPGSKLSQEPFNWKDAWAYRFGAQYRATEALTLRAGFVYDQSPIDDRYFGTRLPGNDRLIYCTGAGYKVGSFTIDLTYVYWNMRERRKTATTSIMGRSVSTVAGGSAVTINAPAPGDYDANAHFVALQVSYAF